MLLTKKVTILNKYSNFINVFLEQKALELLEITDLNQHFIKLEKNKQLLYKLIYNLGLIKLKSLKTYIKTNFANSFIWLSKLPAGTLIFFL